MTFVDKHNKNDNTKFHEICQHTKKLAHHIS